MCGGGGGGGGVEAGEGVAAVFIAFFQHFICAKFKF